MKQNLSEIQQKEIFPGLRIRFVHAENVTLAFWEIDAGSELPEHHHIHEQVSTVTEGKFEMIMDGKAIEMEEGDVCIIPSNKIHAGRAITDCKITDTFYPIREDYK